MPNNGNMSRDDIRKMLGEGATEEQVTNVLNALYTSSKAKDDEINTLKTKNSQYSDYEELKKYKEDVEKSKMTEQEKIDAMKREIEANLKSSRITKNEATARKILAETNISDTLLARLIDEDEQTTINNANDYLNSYNALKEEVVKKTKEELNTLNLQPNIENKVLDDGVMTSDKFFDLSSEEQEKFIEEHPNEFNNF